MIIDSGIVTGSLVSQGPLAITGSVTSTGGFTGSLSGSATSAVSASYVLTSSYATTALTASYAANVPLTASYALTALTASYAANVPVTASYALNSDLLDGAHLSQLATTGSNQFNGNQTVTGSLTVTGNINAVTLVVQTITSSVAEITGSTQHGSTTANTHEFTGSVLISGSLLVNGSNPILSNQTSSMSVATASYIVTAQTASYVLNAVSSSRAVSASRADLATTASYVLNAVSSSYALTASYALNGGGGGSGVGFPFSGSAVITGSLYVTGSTISGSFKGDGSQLYGLAYGGAKVIPQSTPSATWTCIHNFNQQYPNVTVYDSNDNVILPQQITATDDNTLTLTFGSAVSGYAVISFGGYNPVTGLNTSQYFATATTWSFNHNLSNAFPTIQVYDDAFEQMIPTTIRLVGTSSALIMFDSASSGYAVGSVGGGLPQVSSSYNGYVLVANTASAASASWSQLLPTASYALTASYISGSGAGVGFPFSGSAVITGSLFVSSSFISGSFTGSLFGTASYATFALSASNAPGFTTYKTQASPAVTWSFVHNLNTRNPLIQVYDTNYNQVIPNQIIGIDALTAEIRFDYSASGYAVASNGGGLYITGSTSRLDQTTAAVTWSFAHNLNTKYPAFEVYDSNDLVVIPSGIRVINSNSAELYFAAPSTGKAIANFSGINGAPNATTASYAATASVLNPVTNSYVILTQVSASLNFADDTAAAAGGVPLGGLYRNGNFILIRLV